MPGELEPIKFFADEMLGRLAKWLRIMGYDTRYAKRISDYELLGEASGEGRVVLTRDRRLPQKTVATPVVVIHSEHYLGQVRELIRDLKITVSPEKVFSLCLECNWPVEAAAAEEVRDKIPASVYERHQSFHRCPHCRKIFWNGSHLENSLRRLKEILP